MFTRSRSVKPALLGDIYMSARGIVCVGFALGFLAAGCTQKPIVTASLTEATVSGTVRIDGKPVQSGEVVFDPANYQRRSEPTRTASIDKEGKYTIQTLVGQNTVWVTGDAIPLERGMAYEHVVIDVKEGNNLLDIDLGQMRPVIEGAVQQ